MSEENQDFIAVLVCACTLAFFWIIMITLTIIAIAANDGGRIVVGLLYLILLSWSCLRLMGKTSK